MLRLFCSERTTGGHVQFKENENELTATEKEDSFCRMKTTAHVCILNSDVDLHTST